MPELVSICIPTYNQDVFLKRTLESLIIQTYNNFEVVITDDSSNTLVEKLVDQYKSRLIIFYYKNPAPLGSPANWNNALDKAKGSLIKFMHHDDWFASADSLAKFVESFEKNVGFVFCVSEILNVKENSVSYNRPGEDFVQRLIKDPKILFNDNRVGSPSAVMFRNASLRFDEKMKYLVDVDFYIRIINNGCNIRFIDNPLIVNTSNHEGQVTAASLNRQTQVGEYCYLYNKIYRGKIPGIRMSRFFRNLFRMYQVKTMQEIKEMIGEDLEPAWYFKLLLLTV